MDPDEIKKREVERMERKKRKQEERLRKLEDKRKLIDNDELANSRLNHENTGSDSEHQHQQVDASDNTNRDNDEDTIDNENNDKRPVCSFSIDRLLEEPKVPRGRRPNSKYPRVQACKSVTNLGTSMMPLYPVTQPIGFAVEQRQDEIKSDSDVTEHNVSSDESMTDNAMQDTSVYNDYSKSVSVDDDDDDYDADINVTDDETDMYETQYNRNNVNACLDLSMPITA